MQMMVPSVPVAAAKRNCGRFPYFWARTETSGLYSKCQPNSNGTVITTGDLLCTHPSAATRRSW